MTVQHAKFSLQVFLLTKSRSYAVSEAVKTELQSCWGVLCQPAAPGSTAPGQGLPGSWAIAAGGEV